MYLCRQLWYNLIMKTTNTTHTTLTENEAKVIKAYKADCFVSDHGWDSLEAAAWTQDFHKDCGLAPRVFAGTLSSLSKKGLIRGCFVSRDTSIDEAFFGLTEAGIEVAKTVE